MVIDILKHTIVNVCKSVTYGMKKPEVKFFRTCLESILEHRTTVLSNLGKSGRLNSKHVLKYFSRNLGKDSFSNIPKKVEKVLRKFVGELDINTCFCFDSVDLNKYSAKKMEGISKVRDGSTGDIINGYVINAVSVNSIPIIMEREELEEGDEGKTTRFDVFVNHVEKICLEFGCGYWVLCDRLYDDVKKFNLLIEKKLRFAIRMKTYRYVMVLEGNRELVGTSIKVGELPEGSYIVTFKKLSKPCFLVVRKLPGYKTPIRVLSNESDPDIVTRYLKRWEIERVFKSGKQEFGFEKIGTKSKQKIDNLIAMVQLCLGICAYAYSKIESDMPDTQAFQNSAFRQTKRKTTVSTVAFRENLMKYLKRVSLVFNRNSIIGFIGEYMKKVRKMKWNLRVTLKPVNSSQLSLNLGD